MTARPTFPCERLQDLPAIANVPSSAAKTSNTEDEMTITGVENCSHFFKYNPVGTDWQ